MIELWGEFDYKSFSRYQAFQRFEEFFFFQQFFISPKLGKPVDDGRMTFISNRHDRMCALHTFVFVDFE